MKTYRIVPNTRGTARYYKIKAKKKTWIYKTTLSKKLSGKSKYRHLYIKRR